MVEAFDVKTLQKSEAIDVVVGLSETGTILGIS